MKHSQEEDNYAEFLEDHLKRFPIYEAQDVYKFAHQSALGPGHIIASKEAALEHIQSELANAIKEELQEPLWEPLSYQPSLARLNLRPYVKSGGSIEGLVDAMIQTAETLAKPNFELLEKRLAMSEAILMKKGAAKIALELKEITAQKKAEDFPPMHHSEAFMKAYKPSYRVVDLSLVPLKCLQPPQLPLK